MRLTASLAIPSLATHVLGLCFSPCQVAIVDTYPNPSRVTSQFRNGLHRFHLTDINLRHSRFPVLNEAGRYEQLCMPHKELPAALSYSYDAIHTVT